MALLVAGGLLLFAIAQRSEPARSERLRFRGNVIAGAEIFLDAGCGGCHVLSAGRPPARRGRGLDDRIRRERRRFDEVATRIRGGGAGMPAYRGRLSERQIRDVTAFLVGAAR